MKGQARRLCRSRPTWSQRTSSRGGEIRTRDLVVPNHARWPDYATPRRRHHGDAMVLRVGIEPTFSGFQPNALTRTAVGAQPVGESNPYPEIERLRSCTVRRTGRV